MNCYSSKKNKSNKCVEEYNDKLANEILEYMLDIIKPLPLKDIARDVFVASNVDDKKTILFINVMCIELINNHLDMNTIQKELVKKIGCIFPIEFTKQLFFNELNRHLRIFLAEYVDEIIATNEKMLKLYEKNSKELMLYEFLNK